ncbi:UbiD family decarboxylase [Sulfolobus acidocaldarius]|uniref:3-octaprenyl-4-hydroxybenzoate carboxy-lyase n=4 Tax=Sulfolobus acidocaldarius TaxID=2285 RepID=Q4J8Y6_SULAC|nr:UbiD family decarboxylase [Sulfolobus acidocaldarius]AAY80744.1 3-octaprenyl-4-hydroxybenzoate carboxy-lyase [Sulfolobus acidocaldarius DSM 639]AGE71341.1 3-octaprenyl-4-hydroxybenzoate carboxy-lyase [Sulfolobus acidocaldarius N8]AGE73610.1 3-octaprenyl-4-hydroxybenzoate carboxy-lyase [Sulfolobus acidocaldarius Ron12/I]ALU30407.1 menaquinone biosynthesis decarboxylase [Sulfolobus acidocaldarius]ALU31128.1 menaquinone biosynthesis decarboxylase [Sulfolobus acidocaldarius]
MGFKDLREYIEFLRRNKNILEISDEVSTELEIAYLTREATYSKMPALLFTNVKNFPEWKVITNIFNSLNVFYNIFGSNKLEEISGKFLDEFLGQLPTTFFEKIRSFAEMSKLGKVFPKSKKPVFELHEEYSLDKFPALRTWPKDAGRYFTFSITITKDPDTEVHNLSVYRIQLVNQKEAIVHWQAFKRGSITANKYLKKGITKVPVAIINGVDPITTFVAASPVPPGLDKYLFAGILRQEGVEVTRLDNGILVPANAESVIEGYVDLNDVRLEGPFGDHLGYYTPADFYPTLKVERIYVRDQPIFHATSVGKPPLEDAWIGRAVERLFLPFLKMIVPELVDMNLPEYGLFTGIGIFSIRKTYPGQGKRAMMALWGVGQLSLLKMIIVVDEDVNVHDINQILYAISSTVDPKRDVLIVDNVLTDSLDHTTPHPPLGSKIGIDATRKFREEVGREWPEEVSDDPEVVKRMEKILKKIKDQYPLSK